MTLHEESDVRGDVGRLTSNISARCLQLRFILIGQ